MAVVIHHNDVDPMDWAMEKCKALPLSAWDADEQDEVFRAADRVVRTQMTVGLYAVQLLAEAGRVLDCGKLRTFAEKVWAHADFFRQYGGFLAEDSGTAEFAARVAAALGEPDQAWVLQQANSPAMDPQTLWTLLDQMKRQDNAAVHDNTFEEIRKSASDRYINPGEANPESAPHLANLWVLLDAPQEAAKTAQVLLAYHPSVADRANAISTLKMLAFAERGGEIEDELVEASRSLYDVLWGKYIPPDEMHTQQEIDAFLGWGKAAPSQNS